MIFLFKSILSFFSLTLVSIKPSTFDSIDVFAIFKSYWIYLESHTFEEYFFEFFNWEIFMSEELIWWVFSSSIWVRSLPVLAAVWFYDIFVDLIDSWLALTSIGKLPPEDMVLLSDLFEFDRKDDRLDPENSFDIALSYNLLRFSKMFNGSSARNLFNINKFWSRS